MGLSEKAFSPSWNLPETSLTCPGISLSLKYGEIKKKIKKLLKKRKRGEKCVS
jgi:hypothetical protein